MTFMSAAIIGVGSTEQGELPGRSANSIAAEAALLALEDSGVERQKIDGLITCKTVRTDTGLDEQIGALLGISPGFGSTLHYGSANFSLHLGLMAIQSGLAKTILLVYGTNQRSSRASFAVSSGASSDVATNAGLIHVAGTAAMAFRRHQYLYGTTEEQLGMVAVSQREWAQGNPNAIFTKPLSLDQYLAAPYYAEPLRRPDLTMISDGGAALVLTRADLAAESQRSPVYIRGIAQQTAFRGHSDPDYYSRPWLYELAAKLWAAARIGPSDIGALYVQDATSVWVLQMLEAYGFCGRGEAGPFLASGATRPGGHLPINTNGGQLSESYMWGWLHLVEAVRQLRGEAGPRQIPGLELALDCSTHDYFKGAATVLAAASANE